MRAELPVQASEPPPAPPHSLLPSQRHYKSNGLERKASKILKPSSIINADNKFPLGAFYIATVTKTGWWGGCSSPPQPTDLGGVLAVTLPSPHLSLLATTWVPTRLSPQAGERPGKGWLPAERGSKLLWVSPAEAPGKPQLPRPFEAPLVRGGVWAPPSLPIPVHQRTGKGFINWKGLCRCCLPPCPPVSEKLPNACLQAVSGHQGRKTKTKGPIPVASGLVGDRRSNS